MEINNFGDVEELIWSFVFSLSHIYSNRMVVYVAQVEEYDSVYGLMLWCSETTRHGVCIPRLRGSNTAPFDITAVSIEFPEL